MRISSADMMVWAGQSPQAANEAFTSLTATYSSGAICGRPWPKLSVSKPDQTCQRAWQPTSRENAHVWDRIVAKYGLRSRNLRELVGRGDQHVDFAFAYGAPAGPRAFVSTIKLRQAGFTRTIDTENSFRNALRSLIDHKLLPPAAK